MKAQTLGVILMLRGREGDARRDDWAERGYHLARRIISALLVFAAGLNVACGSTVLQPGPWNQIHSDARNSGFNAVHSVSAKPQVKLWTAPVGQISLSSPVVGPNGVVHIGNLAGEAVAINPDGTQRWRLRLGSSIVAPPAVDMGSGEILYVVQNPVAPTEYLSFLYRLSPSGEILTVSTEQNLNTSAAPKIWGNYVFLQTGVRFSSGNQSGVARYYIYVFDRVSLQVVAKWAPVCGHPACGSGPDWFEDFIECLTIPAVLTDCPNKYHARTPGPKQDPSVAIVDARNVVDNPNRPIIIAATGFCAAAMRFDPSAPFNQRLTQLWGHKLVGDCEKPVLCTSPAVIAGTQAVIGDGTGRIISHDVGTGTELWKQDIGDGVQWPPVAHLRQMFVVKDNSVVELDSDGTFLNRTFPQGFGYAAALSLKFLYVTTSAGLFSFRPTALPLFDFDTTTADTTSGFAQSTPALAQNGTLYVSTPSGFIHAYSPASP
ncbi:MAG: PQQ-binding-like beta-propeller repeat protein [Nitrospira sp.]